MRRMMSHEVHAGMAAHPCRWTPRGATASSTAAAWRSRRWPSEGWLLRLPERMLDVMGWVSGELPAVLPLTTQDITPYENGLWHVKLRSCSRASSPPHP
ncbi:DUF1177 family protein [Cupriavidus basilensis]